MTSTERELWVQKIKESVHQELDTSRYNDTIVRDNTNCYSHAIGSTVCYKKLHRVGAISGKKKIDQEFFSEEEIIQLLYQDLKVLDLKIERSSEDEEIDSNQYKIALFIKRYADNKIHDYHFLRFDDTKGWSEKFRGQLPITLGNNLMEFYTLWPWKLIGVFKITK